MRGKYSFGQELSTEPGKLKVPVPEGAEAQEHMGVGPPKPQTKPSCRIRINNSTFRALVDTGADVSLLSAKAFRMISRGTDGPRLSEGRVLLQGASGVGIKVLGAVSVAIQMGSSCYEHEFHVVDSLTSTVILGWDFLTNHNASIRCSAEQAVLQIGGQELSLQDTEYINSLVRLRRNIYVPPRSTVIGKAKFKGQTQGIRKGNYMVSQVNSGFLSQEPGLMIMNGLVNIKDRATLPIAIVNSTNKAFRLKKGNVVARVYSLGEAKLCSVTEAYETAECNQTEADLSVPEKYKGAVERLIQKNSDLFADRDTELGQTDIIKMRIDTGDQRPIRLKPYKTPFALRGMVDRQIDEMLQAKVISPSHSPWSFPVVLAQKKDGSKRFCVDFRQLNRITEKHNWPMPTLDEILPTLGKSKFYSACDLRSGYWQVKMAQEDKHKTAFICHRGLFEFNVMPFGLSCAPGIFCEMMSKVLRGLEGFATAYLDDVLIYSETMEDHLKHLNIVFGRLRKAGLRLKRSKCDFFKRELQYLGHVVNERGIKPNPDKVAAIRDLDTPQTVRDVRSFVGMASFYRRYIPDFSKLVEPLTRLTRKHAQFAWSGSCQEAFDTLKQKLSSPPVLAFPDTTKPYILYTDASNSCIGAVLGQGSGEGERPIQYLSHQLSKTQQNWPIIEKEAYAIVFALQKLRQFLYGAKFTIKCDHKPLKFLLSSEIKNAKVQRWGLMISEFDCTIEYIAGKDNTRADMLSRITSGEPCKAQVGEMAGEHSGGLEQAGAEAHPAEVGVINTDKVDPRIGQGTHSDCVDTDTPPSDTQAVSHDSLLPNNLNNTEEQRKDPEVVQLIQRLQTGKATVTEGHAFVVLEDVLYYVPETEAEPSLKLVIPSHLRELVLKECHDKCCHMGLDKTYDRIRDRYYWRGLYKDVANYVSQCVTCKSRNLRRELRPLQEMDAVRFPFEKIGIDLCGPYPVSKSGNKYLVTITCLYTGWPEIFPVQDKTAETVARVILEELIPRHSCPLTILSDNGREFCNQIVDHICKVLKIYRIRTSAYHPAGNGATERFHRVWNDMVSKELEVGDEWDTLIPAVLTAYRTSLNESRKHSPFYLLYGRDPILTLDTMLRPRLKYMGEDYHQLALQQQHRAFVRVDRHLKQARLRQKRHHDKRAVHHDFEVGEAVFLYNPMRKHKLEKKWLPFFRIMEQTGPVNFVIRNQVNGAIRRVHSSQIQRANLEWTIPAFVSTKRPLRKTRLAVDPGSDGSFASDEADSESEEEGGRNGEESEETVGPALIPASPSDRLINDPAVPSHGNNQNRAESSGGEMDWDSEDEIPLAELLDNGSKHGLKRTKHRASSESEEIQTKQRRVNGVKGGNRKKSNKCNVKNLLEAIAALV